MLSFFKNHLKKIYTTFTQGIQALYTRTALDEDALQELEKILITADVGTGITSLLLTKVREAHRKGALTTGSDLKKLLEKELLALVHPQKFLAHNAHVYLLVGINGSGKTTFAAKLAHSFQQQGKQVMLVAADTFRAAAVQQLQQWSTRMGIPLVTGSDNQDPASVVFAGCQRYKQEQCDVLIIDTAGRLQTKINLMKELEKIKKVIARNLTQESLITLLTVDAMLGQNSLEQARIFHQATTLDGIVLTKMDGTGKGGIVFAIAHELHIPVAYLAFGEGLNQFAPFSANEYVAGLLESK